MPRRNGKRKRDLVADFLLECERLEAQQNWKELISKGQEVLKSEGITLEQATDIAYKIACCYQESGDTTRALRMAKKSLRRAEEVGEQSYVARSVYLISLLQDLENELKEARKGYRRVRRLVEKDSEDYKKVTLNYISCLMKTEKLPRAKKLAESLEIDPLTDMGIALVLLKTQIYWQSGEDKEALTLARHGLEDAEKMNREEEINMFHNYIEQIEQSLGLPSTQLSQSSSSLVRQPGHNTERDGV